MQAWAKSTRESSSSEDDGLCPYERKRLENIKRNNEMLKQLGKVYSAASYLVLRVIKLT